MRVAQPPLKYVALGDSLTAGFQDLTLRGDSQEKGFPQLIADAAWIDFETPRLVDGAPPGLFQGARMTIGKTFAQALRIALGMALPGGCLALGRTPPEWTLMPLGWLMAGREPSQRPPDNLGVPGFELRHLETVSSNQQLMKEMAEHATFVGQMSVMAPVIKAVLQDGGGWQEGKSALDRAVEAQPDLITFWAGNNDALEPALMGHVDDQTLTPLEDKRWVYSSYSPFTGKRTSHLTEVEMPGFATSFKRTVDRLLAETEAEILMMNIPDVTVIPYLVELGKPLGELPFRLHNQWGEDVTESFETAVLSDEVLEPEPGQRSRFPAGTKVGLGFALAKLSQDKYQFTEDEVLDPEELAQISERTRQFNSLIEERAAREERIHLVDVASLLERSRSGVALRGDGPPVVVTNTFAGVETREGRQGYFSYDGIHPSDVGHAILANEVLSVARKALADNPRFASLTQASLIDEKAVHRSDPRVEEPSLRV